MRNIPAPVRVWRDAAPDQISKRFHNILLAMPNPDIGKLIRLLQMFAMPPPPGRGKYQHRDGYRLIEPLNRRPQ